MVCCKGCSKAFKNLTEDTVCGRCAVRTPLPENDWPQCMVCGATYQFLDDGNDCYTCQTQAVERAPESASATSFAMSHPVNPQTHSNSHNVYVNPLSLRGESQLPIEKTVLLRERAQEITNSMSRGYASALAYAQNSGRKVAAPKMHGISASSGRTPVKNINLSQIYNKNVSGKGKVQGHIARMFTFDVNYLWCDVLEEIRVDLDQLYTTQYQHRIISSADFDLSYAHSECLLDPNHTTSTIGNLWDMTVRNGPALHIQPKQLVITTLVLNAHVDYPRQLLEDDQSSSTQMPSLFTKPKYTTKRLRTMSQAPEAEFKRPSKRNAPIASGAQLYSTTMQINEKMYRVKRTSCEFTPGEGIKWTETTGEIVVTIQPEQFAHGQTKSAYKLSIGSTMYAAKEFYNVGNPGDSNQVIYTINHKYLKYELICQAIAKQCLSKFNSEAHSKSLNVFDTETATTFLLTVIDGPEKGRSWIVDHLLDNSNIHKFSGTEKAGNNSGSMEGRTCDAFAHFSCHDSGGSLVLVDIQGIIHLKTVNGKKTRAKLLTLFDVMAHSLAQDKGPGDRGKYGIQDFKDQHTCNNICEALGLAPFSDEERPSISDDGEESEKEEASHGSIPRSSTNVKGKKALVDTQYTSNSE